MRIADCPAKTYLDGLQRDFTQGSKQMPDDFLEALKDDQQIMIDAPSTVATNVADVNGAPHVFLANFGGLIPSKVAIPTPAPGIKIAVPATMGNTLVYLPFLGEPQKLRGVQKASQTEFSLPPVERGAVVWIQTEK
jgi:hypothetical protein